MNNLNIANIRKKITTMAEWGNNDPANPIVTVYLPLRRQEPLYTIVNSLIGGYRGSEWYEENTKGGKIDDIEKILKSVREHAGGHKRDLPGKTWVFCLQNDQLISEVILPEEHDPFLIIGKQPFVGFLAEYMQPDARYLILLLERERAQIYRYVFGNLKMIQEFSGHVPQEVRRGSHNWLGFRSDPNEFRIQRHIRWHLNEFIKKVTTAMFDEFQSGLKPEKYDRVIIGTHSALKNPLYKNLHPYLKEKVAGQFNVDIDESRESILRKIKYTQEKFEKEMEENTLNQIANNEPVAIGSENVNKCLTQGAVDSLVINERFVNGNLFELNEVIRGAIKTNSKIKLLRHTETNVPDLSAILRYEIKQ